MKNKPFSKAKPVELSSLKPSRQCCVCDKPLYGRSDKVFCDITCKNRYHSDVRRHTKSASAVNIRILRKNYAILCSLLGNACERFVVKKLKLKELNFNFDVVSGVTQMSFGLKFDLFEFSWFHSRNDNVTVLQDSRQTRISPFMYKRWERHVRPLQTEVINVC